MALVRQEIDEPHFEYSYIVKNDGITVICLRCNACGRFISQDFMGVICPHCSAGFIKDAVELQRYIDYLEKLNDQTY